MACPVPASCDSGISELSHKRIRLDLVIFLTLPRCLFSLHLQLIFSWHFFRNFSVITFICLLSVDSERPLWCVFTVCPVPKSVNPAQVARLKWPLAFAQCTYICLTLRFCLFVYLFVLWRVLLQLSLMEWMSCEKRSLEIVLIASLLSLVVSLSVFCILIGVF